MYYTTATFVIFVLILILIRLKVPLWLSFLAGSILSGLFFKLGPAQTAIEMFYGTIQLKTIGLMIITILIISLSHIMNTSGLMNEIVDLTRKVLLRPSIVMAALPALIGLLPMPGGTLFSAPMVKSAAGKSEVTPEVMSAINYWYRHVWEHWWPLYPGVMLAITLTGLSFVDYACFQIPLGLIMVLTGLLLYRNTHPNLHAKTAAPPAGTKRKLFIAISPVWILILAWIPVDLILQYFVSSNSSQDVVIFFHRFTPLVFALIITITVTSIIRKVKPNELFAVFKKKSSWQMEITVASVMVLQYLFTITGASEKIADELLTFHVPIVLVAAILPLIAGLVTGLAIGFVGTSFPIILALISGLDTQAPLHAYIALAYGFGHLGQMLSPIHICQIVSNQYFNTGFSGVYKKSWPTFLLNFILVIAYFLLLYTLGI